jgi:hypothetical protein
VSDYDSRDDVRQADDIMDDGVLEGDDTLDGDRVEDPLDTGIAPADRWSGADRFGTTPAEEAAGESLDQRLAQETPDVDPDADPAPDSDEDELTRRGYDVDPRAGRLVEDDEGFGEDTEADSVAWDAGVDGAGASAEEAAIHVIDDEAGDGPLR